MKIENPIWQIDKPDYACIFLTRQYGYYNLWEFSWEISDNDTQEYGDYYLDWTDIDGDEWDDISNCNFDEYLILELLPSIDEITKRELEELKGRNNV